MRAMITCYVFPVILTLSVSLSVSLLATAQIKPNLKTRPGLLACSAPSIERGSVKLQSARLTDARDKIIMSGCFGLNQAGEIGVWVRLPDGRSRTASSIRKNEPTRWQAGSATISLSSPLPTSTEWAQVTLIRNNQTSSPTQLTHWVSVDGVAPEIVPEYFDGDGDGSYSVESGGDDCDDTDPDRYPGNTEVADEHDKDEDCNPATFGRLDKDGDGFFDSRACNRDGNTWNCGTDCNDNDASVHPNQIDILNGRDDNCDGGADEDQTLDEVRTLLGLSPPDEANR